uniref:Uncharacterized protein n=1 Tax=Odontella aurita TaxID=265563 RepID=A0A7S4I5Y7_9STRA|mmetsp:Transcript_20355/g.58873  ORF Transcript_20355/g.58873 Transcript_20355/m.58873 type:complete len:120 (+) Transcript_20355:209-568(+)|eukprot:CAMPEP_0113544512 /NCGR_PEP_ID=MMETSP0015_2-20120614/10750_1 /TAXON_ID=2838 /ORGANISM="Odontella" /LENGTH=119 /DNA_ID=CAMNT_0000444781 /DNA_START=145 /DNA_END=504 /DNA_ORIENTATION=- /assembly_acc=CAM_ASM_000160
MADLKTKSQSLEAQLMSMCASSSQVAHDYVRVKNELESENTTLSSQASELRSRLDENERCIDDLERENYDVQCQVEALTERVSGLTEIMAAMAGQREKMLQTADRWEDALQECGKIGEV